MKRIQRLEFCGTDLRGRKAGKALQQMLQTTSSQVLELSIHGVEAPSIDASTMPHLALGVRDHASLQTLRLGGCLIRDDMLQVLVTNLTASNCHCRLQTLCLRYNSLTVQSLPDLAHLLAFQDRLENLDLASNKMLFACGHGAEREQSYMLLSSLVTPFTKALASNTLLRRLFLSHCGIQHTLVLNQLFRALEGDNPCALVELDLGGNAFFIPPINNINNRHTRKDSPNTKTARPWSWHNATNRQDDGEWLSSWSQWQTVQRLTLPRGLRSDPGWRTTLIRSLIYNTSLVELYCDQGPLPMVVSSTRTTLTTTNTMEPDDFSPEQCGKGYYQPLTDRAIAHVLRRNALLDLGLRQAMLASNDTTMRLQLSSGTRHSRSCPSLRNNQPSRPKDGAEKLLSTAMASNAPARRPTTAIPWMYLLERLGSNHCDGSNQCNSNSRSVTFYPKLGE
ncbi:hypothetical protein ACA910_003481 [Epithemia clementina (nom. ined.)]